MGQYLNELYARNASLQCENKALRQQIDEFKNGKRYKILQGGHDRIVAGYKQENRRLAKELAAAREETIRVRNIWFEQCEADFDSYQKEMEKKAKRISTLEEKYWETIREYDRKFTVNSNRKRPEQKPFYAFCCVFPGYCGMIAGTDENSDFHRLQRKKGLVFSQWI